MLEDVQAQVGEGDAADDARAALDAAKDVTAQAEQAVTDAQANLDAANDALEQADESAREAAD